MLKDFTYNINYSRGYICIQGFLIGPRISIRVDDNKIGNSLESYIENSKVFELSKDSTEGIVDEDLDKIDDFGAEVCNYIKNITNGEVDCIEEGVYNNATMFLPLLFSFIDLGLFKLTFMKKIPM